MKTKIVLWGTNDKDEKVLIGIELVEEDNMVKVIIFSEEVATEEFYNQMMNQWREGYPVPFPEGYTTIERPLSMSEGLLPDELRTMRSDILSRAKTEWHFVVLSAKLYRNYADEIQDLKDRINELTEFDSAVWEEMKSFWTKVQSQVREKNLFKDHANDLRNKTNNLFDSLKTLKRAMDDEFEKMSREHLSSFYDKLKNVEDRIEQGLGLQPIFNELKNLQRTFRDTRFTRKDRSDVWKRLDGAFKLVKEKKYGKKQGDGTALSRINRRYQGLLSAIQKMESSINKDKSERNFQLKRIETTDGQLELQIRQAKMAMIEERITSKVQKLQEMTKTREELEKKIELEKKKEEKRNEKAEVDKVREMVKGDIAKDIESAVESRKDDEEAITQAVKAIAGTSDPVEAGSAKDPSTAEADKDISENPEKHPEPASEDSPPITSTDEQKEEE